MSWFRRKSRRGSEEMGNDPPPGIHRSPGLEAFCEDLGGRPDPAILDLGASSTENLRFMAEISSNVRVEDLFRSSGGSVGQRASIFRFTDAGALSLPEGAWDGILLWDLLHYVERQELPHLGERLAGLCRPGGLLFLLASATARIPTTPLQFRVRSRNRLAYALGDDASVDSPQFRIREVEAMLGRFEPSRHFQLRNGLMEMLFVRRDDGPIEAAGPEPGKKQGGRDVETDWPGPVRGA